MKLWTAITVAGILLAPLAGWTQDAGSADESAFLKAIDENPKNEDAYNQLMKLYNNQGKRKERLKIALRAIQNLGGNSTLYVIVGDENKALGENTKALISYQFALKLDPANANLYNRMGLCLLKLDSFHQAEAAFRAALYFGGGDGPQMRGVYYNNLAVCYEWRKDLPGAYKLFQKAVSLYPEYDVANSNVARISEELRKQGIQIN
jgi:tetratricopeptide (TPR) repeat protein